jgi:glycosyltransferase involved in cell wall biosynthesis
MAPEPRILQFCHCYYGPFLDVARQYAALFKDTSYKVTTIYLTGEYNSEVIEGSACDEVIFLGYEAKDVRGLKLGAMRKLRKIVAERNFVLAIAHRFKPLFILGLATQIPLIGVHHAFGDYKRISRRIFARLFRQRLALIGISDAVRDDLRSSLPTWRADRIETLYNRIDVGTLQSGLKPRSSARTLLSLPQGAFIISNVGRLHSDKDQATLLRGFAKACSELPEGSLLAIIGTGPLQASLHDLAKELGISSCVRFLGQVPDARSIFTAFDLFVLSSDHEPFGMVLLEAMAAGIPILATNCGGAPEVVGDSSVLFPLRDPDALAKLILIQAREVNSKAQEIRIKMGYQRLQEKFCDEAARKRFFSLPMVTDILGSQQSA